MTLEKVKELLAEHLEMDASEITEATTFEDLGVDSLDAVEIMMEMGRHQMLDNYSNLGSDAELPLREFINGDYTTAQLQEKYRQTIQDAIDGILGK